MASNKTTSNSSQINLGDVRARLATMRSELNARYQEAGARIDMVLESLLARQHCAMLGPAGEAKSAITDAVMARIGGGKTFKIQFSAYTTPDELFGLWKPSAFRNDQFQRNTSGLLPEADLFLADEVFKAKTQLNALLMAMNERQFRNGSTLEAIPLMTMVGTSNEMPNGDELAALWDRFVMRQWVKPLSRAGLMQFVEDEMQRRQQRANGQDTMGHTGAGLTLDELRALQVETLRVTIPPALHALYFDVLDALEARGLPLPSTRRSGWVWDIVAASATLNGRSEATADDLTPLQHMLWNRREHIQAVASAVLEVVSPTLAKAQKWYDDALAEIGDTLAKLRTPASDQAEKLAQQAVAATTRSNVEIARDEIKGLLDQARGQGRDTTELARMDADLEAQKDRFISEWMGSDAARILRPKF